MQLNFSPCKDDVHTILVQQWLQFQPHALQFLVVRNVRVVPAQDSARHLSSMKATRDTFWCKLPQKCTESQLILTRAAGLVCLGVPPYLLGSLKMNVGIGNIEKAM